MKKIIVLVFLTAIFSARAETFNLMPLKIHYFGTVAAGNYIIAYGTNGSGLESMDGGKTWKHRYIHEYGEIRKIVNANDTLFGILNPDILLKSVDKGKTWLKTKFETGEDNIFVNILASGDFVYIRTQQSIFRFDKNYNLINEFSDTLIFSEESYDPFSYPKELPGRYDNTFIGVCNNDIIAALSYKYSSFLVLSPDLIESRVVTLNDKMSITNPATYDLRNIFSIYGEPVFNITDHLYKPDADYQNWTYFFADTLYMNSADENYNIYHNYVLRNTFFAFDEMLYANDYINDTTFEFYSDYAIYQYSPTPADTFLITGNKFINHYHSLYNYGYPLVFKTSIYKKIRERNNVCGNKTVLSAGIENTLLKAENLGESWELVSSNSGMPAFIWNDSTYSFRKNEYYSDNNFNEINTSYNYGNTFQPTKMTTTNPEDTVPFLKYESLTNPCSQYFNKDGSGFILGYKSWMNYPCGNIFYTNNYGQSFYPHTLTPFNQCGNPAERNMTNICKSGSKYLFCAYLDNPLSTNYTYIFDENIFEETNPEVKLNCDIAVTDSLCYVHYVLADNFDSFLKFCSTKEQSQNYFSAFEVLEATDSGRVRKSIYKIDEWLEFSQIYELNKDSVFFAATYPARILMYDRKRNTFDNLYENAELDSIFFMELSGKFYILGEELFLENTDRNDLTKWEDAPWDYGRPTFSSVICKGNVALVGLSDSLRPFNYYRMMTEEHAPVGVEIQAEKLYYTNHFYAGNPYPLPGRNLIKTLISYDMSFDLEESILGVYDLSGEQVQNKEHIEINWLNKASAEFIWNCSAVPSGIYFILVRHNGITDSIPIVVEK